MSPVEQGVGAAFLLLGSLSWVGSINEAAPLDARRLIKLEGMMITATQEGPWDTI